MEFGVSFWHFGLRRQKENLVNTKIPLHLAPAMAMALLLTLPRPGQSADTDPVAQSAHLEHVSKGLVGRIGVAARLIGGTDVVTLNPDATFVMASTFKVAVAAALLDRVDKGEIRLDQRFDISPDMFVSGGGVIGSTFVHPGISLSVANLIEVMITESDNTATDICLRLAGGPAAVTARLRALGIEGQRVDRYVVEGIRDFYRLSGPGTKAVVEEATLKDPNFALSPVEPNPDFEKDPRDHTTPRAMLELLLAIDSGTAVSAESRAFLLGAMSRTRTAPARIKGMLPGGTPVEHKSGSLGGVANDVGYVTLPDGRRFAIAVFTGGSTTPLADRDRAIAEVSRTLYDYFLMQPATQ